MDIDLTMTVGAQSDSRDYTQDKVRRRENSDWKGNMENKTTMRYYQHKVK